MSLPDSPSRITVKISPSVDPKSHTPSVRSDGWSRPPLLPSPIPEGPWQLAHSCPYARLPAATDSGVAATGFLIFAASGLPPRRGAVTDCCATRSDAAQATIASNDPTVDL